MDTTATVIPIVPPHVYTIKPYRGEDFKWYWRMVATNGRVVADGSEGYNSKANCERAIKRIIGASLIAASPKGPKAP